MPRKSRKLLNKILCHHMVQGINREYIFQGNDEKSKYLELLKKYYLPFKIQMIAYCIMDNHVHMLIYTQGEENISKFMKQVNSIYAMYYNKKKQRVGYVYRNRFKSVPINTREQMHSCIKYIHMNPVKAKIVEKENEYQYSSYNDFLNQTGFINKEILEFVFKSSQNYIEIFQKIENKELKLDVEKPKLEKVLESFLKKEETTLLEVRKSNQLIQKFINFLNSNPYKISKSDIAQMLQISRATLYRKLKKEE